MDQELEKDIKAAKGKYKAEKERLKEQYPDIDYEGCDVYLLEMLGEPTKETLDPIRKIKPSNRKEVKPINQNRQGQDERKSYPKPSLSIDRTATGQRTI